MKPLFIAFALALGLAMPIMSATDAFAAEKAVKKSGASADTGQGNPVVAPLTANECMKLGGDVLQVGDRCPKGTCRILPKDGRIRNVCITELN